MAKANRFGTFGGVFTPSILTILGVIMYMRLPWLVGQGGLWLTLGIILAAHVISVTTGLSVSSIATNRVVQAGGPYYIVSRSLGLPLGGTLGLALFTGLSFSVSLYVIGFAESLLPYLDAWFPHLGLDTDLDSIRVVGSATLLVLTVIGYASTKLVIRTQYLILAFIALSLVSILGGSSSPPAETVHLEPHGGGASFALLFGIFFPAVTGFTAGVNMSGDLEDARRALPRGTLAAIAVGFVVYACLAVFLAIRVPVAELLHNPQVLQDIAMVPWLVTAGVWGATISSALGSILGAPRILQALSLDRITPRVFAHGAGPSQEPRRALLLTIVIAEGGILIGELNAIAAIVSMFFLATYGFLNLSCAVERWANPDFRPAFRIPTWVSIVGVATCAIIMIQLDLLAMIGATVLLAAIFAILKRRQLSLESGDTWKGVWSVLVRAGLHRLEQRETRLQRWLPNVLAFTVEPETDDVSPAVAAQIGHAGGL